MGKFEITKRQKAAFNKVSKAIKEAQKEGLVFYAKSWDLTAYSKDANEYIEKDFESCFGTGQPQIDCISESGLIADSGADDYPSYRNQDDQEKYS